MRAGEAALLAYSSRLHLPPYLARSTSGSAARTSSPQAACPARTRLHVRYTRRRPHGLYDSGMHITPGPALPAPASFTTPHSTLLIAAKGVLITPSFVMAANNVYSFTHFHTLPRTEIPWPRRMPPSRPPPCQPLSWHGGEPGARLPALSCLGNRCDSLRRAQHPTHTASVTPIRRSNAPGKGTRRRTRARAPRRPTAQARASLYQIPPFPATEHTAAHLRGRAL